MVSQVSVCVSVKMITLECLDTASSLITSILYNSLVKFEDKSHVTYISHLGAIVVFFLPYLYVSNS